MCVEEGTFIFLIIQIHDYPDRPKNEQKPEPGRLKICLRAGFSQPSTLFLFNKTLQGQTEPSLEIMREIPECRWFCCLFFFAYCLRKVHFCWTKTTVHHNMLVFQRLWVDCAVCITHCTSHIAHCTYTQLPIAPWFNSTTASSASPLSPSVGAEHTVTCASTAYLHFSTYTHLYHSKHAERWNKKLKS